MAGSFITRQEWGAKPPKNITSLPWARVDGIAIHYSASYADEFPDYKERVRGIQNYHMLTKGWADIAYNYLVARNGDKFLGRGDEVMSAATLGHNDHTHAICFLGADKVGRDDVTDKGRRAIAETIFRIENRSGKKVRYVNVTNPPQGFTVSGHKVYTSTECPGAELMAFIAMKGWDVYRVSETTYPDHFFEWAAWYLGEGPYAPVGPRHKESRPDYPKLPVSAYYWLKLRQFLDARNKQE